MVVGCKCKDTGLFIRANSKTGALLLLLRSKIRAIIIGIARIAILKVLSWLDYLQ